MNFSTLKAELSARGFSHLSDTRLGQYVNWAYNEINDYQLWPYRVATATGSAPLTVSDLGIIESVSDTGNASVLLAPVDHRVLAGTDLTLTGTPSSFYVDNGVVRTYPVGGTLSVRYFKVPADLTGTDTPLVPTRFHGLIVDVAARKAYLDSDNFEAARELQVEVDRQYGLMVDALLGGQQIAGPADYQLITGESMDW